MKIPLEKIENNDELFKMLNAKDKLKRKYDYLRFNEKEVDYRIIMDLKKEMDDIDILINNYLMYNDDVAEIKCIKDIIIKPDRKKVDIQVSIDNLNNYDLYFTGFVASHGFINVYYDYNNDIIKAKNKAKPSKMKVAKIDMIEGVKIDHYCKIGTNICFYPGIYKIKKGDTIGIAKVKEKVKTLKYFI